MMMLKKIDRPLRAWARSKQSARRLFIVLERQDDRSLWDLATTTCMMCVLVPICDVPPPPPSAKAPQVPYRVRVASILHPFCCDFRYNNIDILTFLAETSEFRNVRNFSFFFFLCSERCSASSSSSEFSCAAARWQAGGSSKQQFYVRSRARFVRRR